MLDELPYDLYYIAATYLSAYDLKSLTQVSPFLREVFAPGAWNLVYILPAGKDDSQKNLVEYIDHRFVDEITVVNATKYGWLKRQYVHQIVFDHRCVLLSSDTIKCLDLGQFLNLQQIKAEALPMYWVNDCNEVKLQGGLRYTTLDRDLLYSDEDTRPEGFLGDPVIYMDYPFTRKITSGLFDAKYAIHLTVSSIFQWLGIFNHALITRLNLIFIYIPELMDNLIFGLQRCVNIEWLAIKVKENHIDIDTTFKEKYQDMMSICNSLKKLRYLQTANEFTENDPMLVFDCIVNDLNESVFYEYQIDIHSKHYFTLIDNMRNITFPCVKALEISQRNDLIYLARTDSQFKAFFPNLQHLSLGYIRLGDYLNVMVGSFAEGLQTLKVAVHGPSDMMWFVKTIPRFKRLRALYLNDWKLIGKKRGTSGQAVHDPNYFIHEYHEHSAKYNELLKHIASGGANASLEEIRKWRHKRVKKMVRSVIAKCPNVKDGEIDYMMNLILDPEAIVCEFGSLDCFGSNYLSSDRDCNPKLEYIACYGYAVWESIFMKCQQLKHLEKLTIDGSLQPFLSPSFENLVCKHDTLKRVKIRFSNEIEPIKLQQLKYSRFITRCVAPVTGYHFQIYERKIYGLCQAYWVDVEGFRKQFAHDIYKEGDYEDIEYTALATSKGISTIENDYVHSNTFPYSEIGLYRFGQEASTWDFGFQLFSSY